MPSDQNSRAVRALERELANVEDNLYRFRIQERADPEWTTGNGQTIGDVIAITEADRDELRAALADLRSRS